MPSSWQLKPLGVEGVTEPVDVHGPLTLGRDPGNSVVLPDAAHPGVSGHHARIAREGDDLVVEDLGSTHGTYVNGRRTRREVLGVGDVVRLGRHGPRFAVVTASSVSDTISIEREAVALEARRVLGDTTLTNLRGQLGLPSESQVTEMVERGSRRNALRMLGALVLLAAGGAWAFVAFTGRTQEETKRVEARLINLNQELNERLAQTESSVARARATYRDQRGALLIQKAALEERIRSIEAGGSHAQERLDALRKELAQAAKAIAMYDPVDLEHRKLEEVGRVRSAVVFLEVNTYYTGEKSGKRLYLSIDGLGRRKGNFRDEGEPYKQESSGSGVCVSADGWILTNAHVVRPEASEKPVNYRDKFLLLPQIEVSAVFSDDAERRPARVVKVVKDDGEDLALVKIEPFEGMPHAAPPDVDAEVPSPGTEVYLFGFPLGKIALQEGDRLIASTFKGIVSRRVDPFLQVDAGVHPGNSGGPMTDSTGRLLGLVTQVQVSNDGRIAPTIGYVIPSSHLTKVWPPPAEVDAAATGK